MGEPTHAYRSHAMRDDYCEQLLPHDSSKGTEWIACGLPHSAHPSSPPEPAPPDMQAALLRFLRNRETHTQLTAEVVEHWLGLWNAESRPPSPPEPAPESEEPRLEPQKCSHGVPVFVPCAQCQYAPTAGAGGILGMPAPARPEPPSLRRMARRAAQELFTRCEHRGSKTISETIDLPCIECGELRLTRLLESVVRECADEAGTYRGSVMLRRRGLSPESAPEPK